MRRRPAGVRVVLDARPLQEPDRAPVTALYLDRLLAAFDADPLTGESFALLLRSDLDDPTVAYARLDVVGRRLLPPTRFLRSAALTVDPFLLRGAALGAAWRAERSGASGAVYHAAGPALPLASDLPVVVTLLDLAPWELAARFQPTPAARFGHRLRSRLLRDAGAVIVGTNAVAEIVRRRLRVRPSRIHVVPLAPRPAFRPTPAATTDGTRRPAGSAGADARAERERLGLPERYLVYAGRYDAREDLPTLLTALARLAADGRPDGLDDAADWPPRVLLVGATPEDRAAVARAAAREGVGDALAYAPILPDDRLAALIRGARAVLAPVLSEAAGIGAIEAIACGRPVVASSVGALPEIVGPAGILVEPRDPDRLAVALQAIVADDDLHGRLVAGALERGAWRRRTWADVAADTRRVYEAVGRRG